MTTYVGLDTATVMGVAFYQPDFHVASVYEVRGTPLEQRRFICERAKEDMVYVFEKQHHFRNAVTARSLLERYGYLKWFLLDAKMLVREASPLPVRKLLGCKNKDTVHRIMMPFIVGMHLTSNHTDALAVALYAAHQDGLWSPEKGMPTIYVEES